MISAVADGLGTQMVFVLILKPQTAYMIFPGQQLLEPLADLFIPAHQSVRSNIIQGIFLDVNIECQKLSEYMRRSKLRALSFVADHADVFIQNQFIRHSVLNEVAVDELADVFLLVLRNTHQCLLFGVRKQNLADHVVPVVMPCSQLLHRLSTFTFP